MIINAFYFSLISILLISCKTRSTDALLKHEEGKPTAEPIPLLWHEVSDMEYDRFIVSEILKDRGLDNVQLLSEESDPYKKWQGIISKFDSQLREKYPDALKSIPVPRLKLVDRIKDRPMVNAFVAPFPFCYRVPIIFHNNPVEQIVADDGVRLDEYAKHRGYAISPDGLFSLNRSIKPEDCLKRTVDEPSLKQFVSWINKNGFDRRKTQCRLSVSRNKSGNFIELSKECDLDPDLIRLASAGEFFVFTATGNIITVFMDLVDSLKEPNQIAGVIAHELGHYYKAHASGDRSIHNYFYDLGKYRDAGYPPKIAELDKIGQLVIHINPPGDQHIKPTGTDLEPILYHYLVSIITNDICDEDHFCPQTCKGIEAPGAFIDGEDSRVQKFFPEEVVKFENAVKRCFQSEISVLKGDLARRDFTRRNENKASVNMLSIKDDLRLDYPFLNQCTGGISTIENLNKFVDDFNKKASSKLCDERTVLSEAQKQKIGYYTSEQEADDIALELLFLTSSPVTAYQNGILKLAELDGDPGCKKWLAAQKGKPIPVLNSYTDIHHETCFRWHEIGLEMARHNYINRAAGNRK